MPIKLQKDSRSLTSPPFIPFLPLNTSFSPQALHGWVPPIVHRDMKSQNILVTLNLQLKIADFGTARFAVQDAERECRRASPTPGFVCGGELLCVLWVYCLLTCFFLVKNKNHIKDMILSHKLEELMLICLLKFDSGYSFFDLFSVLYI